MAIHPFLYFWSQHIFLSRFARDLLGQLVKHILHLNGTECDRDGWCTKRRELKYFNVQHLSGSEVSRWIFFVVTRALLFLEIFRRSTVGWDSSHKSAHQTLQKAVFDGVTLLLHVLVHKSENLFSFFQLLFALLQVECDVNFSFLVFCVTIEIVFQVQLFVATKMREIRSRELKNVDILKRQSFTWNLNTKPRVNGAVWVFETQISLTRAWIMCL